MGLTTALDVFSTEHPTTGWVPGAPGAASAELDRATTFFPAGALRWRCTCSTTGVNTYNGSMPFRRRMSRTKTLRARAMRKAPTPAEALLWSLLRREQLGVRWRRQVPMLGYIADFYCPALKLVIEVDGPIHDRRVAYDNHRDAVMRAHGLSVVRLRNEHVLEHSAQIIEALHQRG